MLNKNPAVVSLDPSYLLNGTSLVIFFFFFSFLSSFLFVVVVEKTDILKEDVA